MSRHRVLESVSQAKMSQSLPEPRLTDGGHSAISSSFGVREQPRWKRSTRLGLRWAVPLLVLGAVAGCEDGSQVEECNAFIDKVNASLKQIEAQTNERASDDQAAASEMRSLADQYDKLSSQVGALEITEKKLKGLASEYREMASRAASAARQVATAIDTKDLEKATNAQKEFDQIVKQEDGLVDRINKLCQAK